MILEVESLDSKRCERSGDINLVVDSFRLVTAYNGVICNQLYTKLVLPTLLVFLWLYSIQCIMKPTRPSFTLEADIDVWHTLYVQSKKTIPHTRFWMGLLAGWVSLRLPQLLRFTKIFILIRALDGFPWMIQIRLNLNMFGLVRNGAVGPNYNRDFLSSLHWSKHTVDWLPTTSVATRQSAWSRSGGLIQVDCLSHISWTRYYLEN